jgi:hypothetical protein
LNKREKKQKAKEEKEAEEKRDEEEEEELEQYREPSTVRTFVSVDKTSTLLKTLQL